MADGNQRKLIIAAVLAVAVVVAVVVAVGVAVYVFSADSTAPATDSAPPSTATPPVGTVFYTQYSPTTYRTALHAKTAADPARVLTADERRQVTVSPDGRQLAWVDFGLDGAGEVPPAKLMLSETDGGNTREVASGANLRGLCNVPAWSPDSRRVLFQLTATTATTAGQWASIDVATGERLMLAAPTGCYPVWAPDGQSIAWHDNQAAADSSGIRITDAAGGSSRFVPYIQGVRDPCGNGVVALSPGARLALVDTSQTDRHACGDGPGRSVHAGLVVDTSTGNAVHIPVTGPLRTGVFLGDGSLLVLPVAGREFILLNPRQHVAARIPESSLGDEVTVLAYTPG